MSSASSLWEAGLARSRLAGEHERGQAPRTLTGPVRASLPEGVVTFLLGEVEGSARLWEQDESAMDAAMSLHDQLVEQAVADTGGVRRLEQGEGGSVVVAFAYPRRRLRARWSFSAGCGRRSGRRAVSFGFGWRCTAARPQLRPGDYGGAALRRCARLRALAHGGQTLLSRATFELVAERLPEGASLKPLGPQRLKDLTRAVAHFVRRAGLDGKRPAASKERFHTPAAR